MLLEQDTNRSAGNKGEPIKEDASPVKDEIIRIGKHDYLLSKELQLECFPIGVSSYESTKSILAIGEPHSSVEAQFNLFKGLEIFFRDNPNLVDKTTFLAEGFPANEPISVQQLIEADPHPDDELIRQTLSSFLITGYMAYEWKYQHKIPIIGTENQELYEMSRYFATWCVEDPNALFATIWTKITKTKVRATRIPVGAAWTFAVNIRNKSIATTLINKVCEYENPILFVGSGHLNTKQDDAEFELLKEFAMEGPDGPFRQFANAIISSGCENHSIHYYLQQAKIGYTALEPFGLDNKREEMNYQRLFETQLNREATGDVDYEGYMNWLLRQRKLRPGQSTTVRPSPEAAAEFVRRLKEQQKQESGQKSGIIYEDHSGYAYWFHTSPQEEKDKIGGKFGVDSIWKLGPAERGRAYEVLRGAEPANNLKYVDDLKFTARTVTGMKTIELRDPTYRYIDNLDSRIRECIDELERYPGGTWKGQRFDRGIHFDDVYLEIGIPADKATRAQIEKILEMQDYAQTKGITLVINEVP